MKKFLALAGAVAGATYFFDPDNGKKRRAAARDRTLAFFRRGGHQGARMARGAAAGAYGVSKKVTHMKEEEKPAPDDATLARKVETEIFRDADVPKGQINVNAESGVVVLRGEVEQPEMVNDLEKKTRKVQGVRDVENLLHTPGQEAPTR